ncbi:hypothetical protein Gasu2_26590 [Galdieria sulphuraria]|nr:hypothetical protein Gasu2_26590 [Galdieria sulphuraria]
MSTVNDIQNNFNQKKEEKEEEYNKATMSGSQKTIENMPNGTLAAQSLDEENAKKAFQQAMLAEARAALQRRSHTHSSSRSSPARSVDSDRQNTDKELKRESDNITIDNTT